MQEFLAHIDSFWLWLALAFFLLAVEVLIVPMGLFLCMGTAAAILALVTFLVPDMSWMWAVTLFSFLMVLAGYGWWRYLRGRFRQGKDAGIPGLNERSAQLVGHRAHLLADTKAGRGRIMVNDSPWNVKADGDYPSGTLVEVISVNGITLNVKKVG